MTGSAHVGVPLWGVVAVLVSWAAAVGIVLLVRALPKEVRSLPVRLLSGLLAGAVAGLGSGVFFLLVTIDTIRIDIEQTRYERHKK